MCPPDVRTPVTAPFLCVTLDDRELFNDPHTHGARALRKGLGDIRRIGAGIVRKIESGGEIVNTCQGPVALDFRTVNLVRLNSAPCCKLDPPAHLLGSISSRGKLYRAAGHESGRLSNLRFEGAVKILGVFGQMSLRLGFAQRRQEAGCVPGRSGGQPMALEEQYLSPA